MTYRRTRKKRPTAPVRKTDRRWRVPPPLVHGPEPLEGGTILEELEAPMGVVLWQAARDVSLWVSTPAEERGELFSTHALERRRSVVESLSLPTMVADAMMAVSDSLRGDTESEEIARACAVIADWADSESLPGVSLAYAQAVALIRDSDPGVAYAVGVQARRRSEDSRAETWFRRSVMLARQNGDWSVYSQAFLALGDLYIDRESYSIARKFHIRASRSAKRHSLHALEEQANEALGTIESRSQGSEPKDLTPRRSGRARP